MAIQRFASNPSDPLWVAPRWQRQHVITVNLHDLDRKINGNGDRESARQTESGEGTEQAKALDDAASRLHQLCALNAPLADIQAFLAKWEEPSLAGRIQPNALAWFNDSRALRQACEGGSLDTVRLLLEKGLQLTPKAVLQAGARARETGNYDVIKLLVDFGWDVNEPLDTHVPSLVWLVLVPCRIMCLSSCLKISISSDPKSQV
jgi:hypothetical protein